MTNLKLREAKNMNGLHDKFLISKEPTANGKERGPERLAHCGKMPAAMADE